MALTPIAPDQENLTDTLWAAAAQLDRVKRMLTGMTQAEVDRFKVAGILEDARKAAHDAQLTLAWITGDLLDKK